MTGSGDIYLVDTSVWIEFLRRSGSPAHLELRALLRNEPNRVAITEPVTMEIHSGAESETKLATLEALTGGISRLPFDASIDFHVAARLFRAGRAHGTTVRTLLDCLVAAVAVRTGATLLHRDRDYEHLAAAVPQLRTRSLR